MSTITKSSLRELVTTRFGFLLESIEGISSFSLPSFKILLIRSGQWSFMILFVTVPVDFIIFAVDMVTFKQISIFLSPFQPITTFAVLVCDALFSFLF